MSISMGDLGQTVEKRLSKKGAFLCLPLFQDFIDFHEPLLTSRLLDKQLPQKDVNCL